MGTPGALLAVQILRGAGRAISGGGARASREEALHAQRRATRGDDEAGTDGGFQQNTKQRTMCWPLLTGLFVTVLDRCLFAWTSGGVCTCTCRHVVYMFCAV